jgi:quinohemoprotein ethanol dehydrogenase
MIKKRTTLYRCLVTAFTAACLSTLGSVHAGERIIDDKAINDASNTADWLAYGRTHSEQRFSPLKDINVENVAQLKPEWYLDISDRNDMTSTPLVVDGIMYHIGHLNVVRAIDARTGKQLWTFDPKVADEVLKKNMRRVFWGNSRGLSTYGDKLYIATWDGRIVAINRKDGKEVWQIRTFPADSHLNITGHVKAFDGKLFVGNGGTELGASRGFVTAYDAETGKQIWRWYIVPGNPADGFENKAMEMAAKTWGGKWWEHGGGGNAWHGWTYDEEFDQLIFGTGNGSPWNAKIRSPGGGDNLFLSSVVALDADTGEYKWHVQTAPGDAWDYNSNMDIVLADLKINGKDVKAAMHAPKNGFFYVIDRSNGKVLSAEKFADANWSTEFDLKSQRHVVPESALYNDGEENIYPSYWGAHSWHAMSYNPELGLVFIPTQHMSTNFSDAGLEKTDTSFRATQFRLGIAVGAGLSTTPNESLGSLQAWDPVKQKRVWEVNQKHPWGAGTLATAGNLVFQGLPEGKFKAYDARNGKVVWEYDAGLGISSPPITYKLDGKQMVAIMIGPGGGHTSNFQGAGKLGWDGFGYKYGLHQRRMIAFSLDGTASVPKQPAPQVAKPIVDKNFQVDEAKAAAGAGVYALDLCIACHGAGAISGGVKAPDLRASAIALDKKAFEEVVRNGALMATGMPRYHTLSDEALDNLRHYIRQQAHAAAPDTSGH